MSLGSSGSSISPALITGTLILVAGAVDDMRSRKFHNWLFITLTICAVVISVATGGWLALNTSLLGFAAAVVAFLPLVLIRIIGAGDLKLLAAFGAAVGWSTVIDVAILSLLWGAIFGVIQIVIKGQFVPMLKNLAAITRLEDRQKLTLHTIPFTIAIFFSWLTHLVQTGVLK